MILLLITGCGRLENGRCWGEDAFGPIDLERIGQAAHDAFFNWQTLVPLAGAAVFAIDDLDENTSDWAARRNPIFGSEDGARDASDYLNIALQAEFVVSALATPSGDDSQHWLDSKVKGMGGRIGRFGCDVRRDSFIKRNNEPAET